MTQEINKELQKEAKALQMKVEYEIELNKALGTINNSEKITLEQFVEIMRPVCSIVTEEPEIMEYPLADAEELFTLITKSVKVLSYLVTDLNDWNEKEFFQLGDSVTNNPVIHFMYLCNKVVDSIELYSPEKSKELIKKLAIKLYVMSNINAESLGFDVDKSYSYLELKELTQQNTTLLREAYEGETLDINKYSKSLQFLLIATIMSVEHIEQVEHEQILGMLMSTWMGLNFINTNKEHKEQVDELTEFMNGLYEPKVPASEILKEVLRDSQPYMMSN